MKITLLLITTVFFGCSTLPSDAPPELKTAQLAIENMRQSNASSTMPQTAEFAEKKFKSSVQLYNASRESDSLASREDAVRDANIAIQYATAVTDVEETVSRWDKNTANFQEALAFLDVQESGPIVASMASEPVSPLAKMTGTEIVTSVGFFEPGSAKDPLIAVDEFESLMDILNRDESFTVTLIGSTDSFSEKSPGLAMERALSIANKLSEFGIDKDRIALKTMPLNSKLRAESKDSLPWNRRVVARVILLE